ncbi:MAG: M56 family metallopeptidase [Planctomycetes bacterium]|nr:M56 family metallopeptidase [Planctomycetota bacterium]
MDAASWALAVTLQATPLLFLAWAADRLLARRVWPQLLQVLWLIALLRFFLPPDLVSPWSVTEGLGERALAAAEGAPSAGTAGLLGAGWIAGALVLLGLRAVRRVRLRAQIERLELPRAWERALERSVRRGGAPRVPRIGTLVGLASPAVLGLFRPVLLLPRSWTGRAPARSDEHALLHELAHLQRGDLWLDELCACVRALVWFHPLVWLATARIHALGELGCDQRVARSLGAAAGSYRETLVHAARGLLLDPEHAGVRSFLGRRNELVLRIAHLERARAPSLARVRVASAALFLLLAACVLPMASAASGLRAQAQHVLAAQRSGERQSCFTAHAAALVLAADPAPPTPEH